MNLKRHLEQRSVRGTSIGSAALIARLDAQLSSGRVHIARPGVRFAGAAFATLALIGGTIWVLRPDAQSAPVVTTTVTTVTTTATTPDTTTTVAPRQTTTTPTTTTALVEEALANRMFVWNFDPATGELDDLRTALETYDASPYVVIRLMAEGGVATQRIVFDYLERPSAWSVQTLVAMEQYGSPAGTRESPQAWPTSVAREIHNSLGDAASNTFGDDAELVVALQRALLEQNLSTCSDTDACDFGTAWYAVPEAVLSVSGEQSGLTFDGTMFIGSDTGAGGEVRFTAVYEDGWTILEAKRPSGPSVTIDQPSVMVVVSADVDLSGYAVPDAALTIERRYIDPEGLVTSERPVVVDPASGYWAADAWDTAPEPGIHDIRVHATLADGTTETASVIIFFVPNATRQFAFIRGIDTTGDVPALIVDYAEFLSGDEAVRAAIEDGELPADEADEGLLNDYYIRNQNPRLRTLSFGPNAPIYLFDYTRGEEFDLDYVTLDELALIMESGSEGVYYGGVTGSPVWLVVQDDVILQLEPQYLP